MTEPGDHTQALLQQLESAIRQAAVLDPQKRRRIEQLLVQVEQLLREEPDVPLPPPLQQDLMAVIVDFEAGHPALADSLRRLTAALSSMGI